METEMIDKLFLELAQFTRARTPREIKVMQDVASFLNGRINEDELASRCGLFNHRGATPKKPEPPRKEICKSQDPETVQMCVENDVCCGANPACEVGGVPR